MEICLGADWL